MPAALTSRRLPAALLLASVSLVASVAVSSPVLAQEPSPEPVVESASPAPTSAPLPSQTPEVRPEGSWDVSAYDPWAEGLVQPRANTSLTVSLLQGGRLEGKTGCGDYFGGYSVDGENIGLGVISKGFNDCTTKRVEEAVAFSVALESVASWRAGSDGLELLDESGAVRVVLERPLYRDVNGDWLAQRYARSNGAMVEPLAGAPITLNLREDGSVAGSSGCRFLEGEYSGEGQRILIGPIDTVGPVCEGEERKQERRLFRLFGQIVLWQRDADGLTFTDAFGEPLLVMTSADTTVQGLETGEEPGIVVESAAPAGDGE